MFLFRIRKVLKLGAGAMRASASLPAELKDELVDVRRRLRALQKQAAKQAKSREREDVKSKFFSILVLLYSGGAADVVADYVQGRGRCKRRGLSPSCTVSQEQLVANVHAMYDALPVSQLAALEDDPVAAGLVTEHQMLSVLSWLVQRCLHAWVHKQNVIHGVAPSRAQLIDQAISAIPSLAPRVWQQKLRASLSCSQRSERRWLAKFRRRWDLRLGKLKPCSELSLAQKQSKACGWASPFLVAFGSRGFLNLLAASGFSFGFTACAAVFGCV